MNLRLIPIFVLLSLISCGTERTPVDQAHEMLDSVRMNKKEELSRYLELLESTAQNMLSDPFMQRFFMAKDEYYRLSRMETPPAELSAIIEDAKASLQELYLLKYQIFYDILLINVDGDIFSTIRRQADYHQNIFEGELGETPLARRLRSNPSESFVDYSWYEISGEPSAFLVKPVYEQSELLGWFVFQCAINRINTMFSREEELGQTGEVLLVNRDKYLLTDSRFIAGSAILTKSLSAENITSKFRQRSGHMRVTDYRGYEAVTSFEVCPALGSEWLIIAKIDEDEIITEHFRSTRNREQLEASLRSGLSRSAPMFFEPASSAKSGLLERSKYIEVDIDEFKRAEPGQLLVTPGVSTCTAVAVSLPGQFAYLAHISPYDVVYGETQTDLMSHLLKRIERFDLYPYQKRDLRFTIIAPHLDSLSGLIDRLLEHSYFLSQIRFMHVSDAGSADVRHDVDQTLAIWRQEGNAQPKRYQRAEDTPSLEEFLKPVLAMRGFARSPGF